MGQIITFYSYKGGVGRTMALANVAVLLSRWGYRTLIVDWDLEAPGLEYFFKDYVDVGVVAGGQGVVDLLHGVSGDAAVAPPALDWRSLLITVQLPESRQPLHLLTAGERGDGYFGRVRGFDVAEFYAEKKGGLFIESLRDEWKRQYDFVLLDSRTGVTDIGGICTIQLPDLLVMLFTATEQGFGGVVEIVRRAAAKRQQLPVDRLRLVSVPLPSRFDSQVEFKISQAWLDRFAEELSEVYSGWLPKGANARALLEMTKIPYVPYFSFGERLAVIEQGTTDPAGLGYAYETLAAMIANNLESVEQLLDNRAEFVRTASRSEAAAPRPDAEGEPVTVETFRREWLDAHRQWLDSDGRKGRRLDLKRAILKGIDLRGANLRKADFTWADLSDANLSGADLSGAELTLAMLHDANLSESDLRAASLGGASLFAADLRLARLTDINLNGADLRGANLSEAQLNDASLGLAKLSEADFSGANLRGAGFADSDVRRATFREADLSDADLSEAKDLWLNQLAGAVLIRTMLPETILVFEGLADFNRKSWFVRARYLIMLLVSAYLLYAGATFYTRYTAAVSEAVNYQMNNPPYSIPNNANHWIDPRGELKITNYRYWEELLLPSPYAVFLYLPLCLFVYYLYFNVSLQPVWAELSTLPDVFPDGKPLDRKIQPTYVGSVLRLYARRRGGDATSYYFPGMAAAASIWLTVPATLAFLFVLTVLLRLPPYKNESELEVTSGILGAGAFLSLLAGAASWWSARRTLRRERQKAERRRAPDASAPA